MVVVAGPSGSGKSFHFPVEAFGCGGFNVDLRAAALNSDSSQGIPPAVRRRAQQECEAFVMDHIRRGRSFAVESTLRSSAAIEQARQARGAGFATSLVFVSAGTADECVERVRRRGLAGGHAAPEIELRDIHVRSLSNLLLALEVFDEVELYDNTVRGEAPRFLGNVIERRLVTTVEPVPEWVPERWRSR